MVSGVVGLGQHRVTIKSGRMKPLDLVAGGTRKFDWGDGGLKFQYARVGNQVQFSPNSICISERPESNTPVGIRRQVAGVQSSGC